MLYYLKNCPTFDVQAATFGLWSKACEQAHRLSKVLERTLRTVGVLPARTIDSLAPMQVVFTDGPVLLLDATEQPHHRPQAVVDRKANYSGKKRLTRKNTLITDPSRYIHCLGPTTSGSTHDFQLLKDEFDVNLDLFELFV